MRCTGWGALALACAGVAACAHTAEGPLDVPLGLPRAQVGAELRRFDYCAKSDGIGGPQETFPRCAKPGLDWSDSWVVVDYDGDRLVHLRRWERWDDEARATERWNQLVTARAKKSPADAAAARSEIVARHDLPSGTRTWTAFWAGDRTIVAIYLLEPRAPENASILEEIVLVSPEH